MARKSPKAIARKITHKRALSYDRMVPNPGVTTLSEVNGRGSFAAARRRERFVKQQTANGLTHAQAVAAWRRSTRKGGHVAAKMKANLARKKRSKRLPKGKFIARQRRAGRTAKQAANDWAFSRKGAAASRKRAASKSKSKARKKRRRTPSYGPGIKPLTARVGRGRKARKKRTYLRRTKKGNVRKIPDYALLGYKSGHEMRRIMRDGTDRQKRSFQRRYEKLLTRRQKAGERAKARAEKGRAWFSPNGEIISLEEWTTMKPNARKKSRKKSRKKKTTARSRWISRQMRTKGRSRKQAAADYKGHRSGKRRVSAAKKRMAAPKRRRKAAKKCPPRKKRPQTPAQRRASMRNLKKACKTRRLRANKSRRSGSSRATTRRRSTALSTRPKSSTRRRSPARRTSRRRVVRRTYRRNAMGAAYMKDLKTGLMIGLRVTAGFTVHRVFTNLLDQHGLSKVGALQTGTASEFRKLIAGAIIAGVGIPVTAMVLKKDAAQYAGGMAASLFVGLVQSLAAKWYPQAVPALSAYTNAPGYAQVSGVGAYYEFSPHQVYNGMGEFYETSPVPGLEQAAAGFGQPMVEGQMLTQAAAGVQQMYANPNAAGEFFVYGTNAIGEYESVPTAPDGLGKHIDDGIYPNLHSAERELNVAEAAAGVDGQMLNQAAAGFGSDIPLQQTVQPMIRALDIPDRPGGSRAGTLAGRDGIFG